ncbi:MAG: MarR family transcriptional regulator [Paraburkholderia sp.]|nr:MarR family transcriptional regulator [Paraburkholderia sp.]
MTEPTLTLPPEIANYPFGESVGYLLSRVKSTMSNMVTQRTMAELGITSTQASILFMVASGKCLLAAELAREYGIDASAVTRLIDRLEKRGLLTRVRSSEDRRAVRLALTPEGLALAARMPEIFNGVMDKLLAGFTAEETGFLKSMLRRILITSCDTPGSIREIAINTENKS